MPRSKKRQRNSAQIQKNKVRGLIGQLKNRNYSLEPTNKSQILHMKLSGALLSARESLGTMQIEEFLKWVESQTAFQLPSLKDLPWDSELLPESIKSKSLTLEKEIVWVCFRLRQDISDISEFRNLVEALESAAWNKTWVDVNEILNRIEETTGKSLWLIETKIGLEQHFNGLESQKKIVVKERKLNPRSLSTFFARNISVRNEPTTVLNRYLGDINDRIDSIEVEPLRSFLKIRLLPSLRESKLVYAQTLQVAQGLSLVDLYETLLAVIQNLIAIDSQIFSKELIDAITSLNEINDFRLQKIILLLGEEKSNTLPCSIFESTNQALEGNPELSLLHAIEEIEKDYKSVTPAITAALQVTQVEKTELNGHWKQIWQKLVSIFRFDSEFDNYFHDFEKCLKNWNFSPTAISTFHSVKAKVSLASGNDSVHKKLAFINRPTLELEDLQLLPDSIAKSLVPRFKAIAQNPLTKISYGNNIDEALANSKNPFAIYYSCSFFHDRQQKEPFESLLSKVDETYPRSIKLLLSLMAFDIWIIHGDINNLIFHIVDGYIYGNLPLSLLPLKEALEGVKWRQIKPFQENIDLPIFLCLGHQATGYSEIASNLRYSFIAFLNAHKLSKPIELENIKDQFPLKKFIFFLRYVCIPTVFDMSPFISTSREAEEERSKICSLLSQLDPENKGGYETEIFDITHTLYVQDGLKIVDSSRVHVDTDALKDWVKREWGSNFSRYVALVEAGIGVGENFDDILKKLDRKKITAKNYLDIPESEADQILI